jgi:hypothetical protein
MATASAGVEEVAGRVMYDGPRRREGEGAGIHPESEASGSSDEPPPPVRGLLLFFFFCGLSPLNVSLPL